MKIKVDEELCTGCGLCSDNCSEVFELTDDIAQVVVDEIPPEHEDCVRDAVDDCPVEAITIIEE